MDPRDIMQAIKAKTGDLGAAFYFHPDTLARGKELGLSGMRFYTVGRGGVLGNVDAAVVQSAFGYFHPELLAKWWNQGCEVMAPRDAAREYIACCDAFGRSRFSDVDGLEGYVDAATAIIEAVDGGALALFAGVRAEPVPADAAAAAAHQAMVLRELRGSAHLAAVAASGLSTPVAHAIKRPDDLVAFGYEEPPTVTDTDRSAHARAEQITDDILAPAYSVLTDDQADALIAGTTSMHDALFGS